MLRNDDLNAPPSPELSTVTSCSPPEDRIRLRLPEQDLRCGDWISTWEGDLQRLWVVEAINTGAGDGCIELTLAPKRP